MSQDGKKDSIDEIVKRSVELFGLTPDEISDRNVEWMEKNGYKKSQYLGHESQVTITHKSNPRSSKINDILKRLGLKRI